MTTLTEYEKDQVRSLYYHGMNPQDIAEELNLDELAVMEYCSEELFR